MNSKATEITQQEKETLLARLSGCLEKRPDIVFAYVHGSFVAQGRFNDIDVAVFLTLPPDSPLQMELSLEAELGSVVGHHPLDVRVLNGAPLSFRYNVVRYGRLLFVKDDDIRSDFAEAAICNYLDFAPFRRMYLKEALGLAI